MASEPTLAITGEVERPLSLSLTDIRALAEEERVADFHCHEGWSRLGRHWRGVTMARLLALAGATPSGRHVTVASGDYVAVLSREQAEDDRVLLAVDEQPDDSGGFPRLVGPSEWDCFLSVKSVDRIELTVEPGPATAATIALTRIGIEA